LISLIGEAVAALWANRLRSFLTIFGMVMGVTSVIAIVSTVEGMQGDIERSFDAWGADTFMVTRIGMALTWEEYAKRMKRKKLTREMIPLIENGCPECEMVGAEAYAYDNVKWRSGNQRTEIRGETPNLLEMRDFDVEMGRYLSWEDEYRKKNVAFIGHFVYTKLFEGVDPIGERIRVGGREFTVIGVAEKMDGTMVEGMDRFVAIPLATHQKIYQQPGNPVLLVVKAYSLENRKIAEDQVRAIMRSARRIPYGDDDDFEIISTESIMDFINDITRAFRIVMVSIPLLSIVIGGIVIMNIMMISVTERTREIGIRKSIGARKRNILTQFLYESVILSLLGGGIGIYTGILAGRWMLQSLMDIYVNPTGLAIIVGFGISTGVGLFFGIYPAMKAARYDPIKALSYE
ncbi:MAG: ABC transporter permease, partial [Candidatus Zixiibacteriota bacterium]